MKIFKNTASVIGSIAIVLAALIYGYFSLEAANTFSSIFEEQDAELVIYSMNNLKNKHREKLSKKFDLEYSSLSDSPLKRKKVIYIEYNGDVYASENTFLKEYIEIIDSFKEDIDEVVINVNSGGGSAVAYNYAASLLSRIKKMDGIKLTVVIDQVAASGGYLIAVVADKILAAPNSIIGSIGVVSEHPNIAKAMERLGVKWKSYTVGKYKRTVNMFEEPSKDKEKAFIKQLDMIFSSFKGLVKENRPKIDINKVATGEIWTGNQAKELHLVDDIMISDEYLKEKIYNQM